MCIHETHDLLRVGSISAAKYALAARNTSLTRRSSATSRARRRFSSSIAVLGRSSRFGGNVIRELLGDIRYFEPDRPSNGSEDFSQVLDAVPGAFFGLGACPPDLDADSVPQNHSPLALFSDHVLPEAAAVYAALAIERARVAQ
ncbi:hypothetical protein [Rhodococcus opacus]|uniref:hypothetical protein n=1 Tax=Rhodococcus opacus TaxID=37919 RepID=UPI002473A8C2|nr:hypothetical protein [Rhodococcus opacus]MDH6292825.1 metal-dependent amidase/aminoacylase/carboxypeptidase family protein [Rhodococcus opacus]